MVAGLFDIDPARAAESRLLREMGWPATCASGHRILIDSRHCEGEAAVEMMIACKCGVLVRRKLSYPCVLDRDSTARALDGAWEDFIGEHRPPTLAELIAWGWFDPETT